MEKSIIFSSVGVTNRKKDKIASITHMQFTSNLGKYSGFKLHHGRVTKQDFDEVTDMVVFKLASWKCRLLI